MAKDSAKLQRRFGKNIRDRRRDKGLSQERLAELADVHWTYVGKVERGQINVSLQNIARFAIGLKCKPDDLMRDIL